MIEKENNFVSVVVYLQENEMNILNFLGMLYSVLKGTFKKYEIICVTNSKNEIIVEKLKTFKSQNYDFSITLIKLDEKQGLEECMNAGVDLAIGDFVFEFDSCYVDYEASLIIDVYNKLLEGFDIVSAVPPKGQSRLVSRFFYKIYNWYSNMKKLSTERFRLVSRRVINRVASYNKIIPYRKAIYASSGFESAEVKYVPKKNATGNIEKDVCRYQVAVDSLILFTDISYKITFSLAIIMAIFMFGTGIYTVVVYFGSRKPVEGWAPLMGLISAGFLVLLVILIVIIKYMDLMLRLEFKKQKYVVIGIDKI